MLASCVAGGLADGSYRDPDHPLQLAIRAAVAGLAGEPVAATGVDGCGAPLFALSLTGVARAFQALVSAPPVHAERTSPTPCAPIRSGHRGPGARSGR